MQVDIIDLDGVECGTVELDPRVFGLPFRKDIISQVIRWQNAKRQSGNHATRTIGLVSGTTRKPYKQKGTGRARQGSLRSPQFRGGAVIFGPSPRSHAFDLPKRIRRLGVRTALSYKLANGGVRVVRDFAVTEYKSKMFMGLMTKLGLADALLVGEAGDNIVRCVSNLFKYDFLPDVGLNVLDIVRKKNVLITLSSLQRVQERFSW